MGASNSAPPKLDVSQLSTWTVNEVQTLRSFYVSQGRAFAMGRDEFVALLSDAPLQSTNIFGRTNGVGTLPIDLWHALGTLDADGDSGAESSDDDSPARHAAPDPCAVNAMELFAGLTVYAHGDTTTKAGMLFDIVDAAGAGDTRAAPEGGDSTVAVLEGAHGALGVAAEAAGRGLLTHDELVLLIRAAHSGCCKLMQRIDLLTADETGAEALSRACFAAARVPLAGGIRKNQLVAWSARQLEKLGPLRTLESTLQLLAAGPSK